MAENNKEKDNELDDTEDSEEEDIGVGNARQNKRKNRSYCRCLF